MEEISLLNLDECERVVRKCLKSENVHTVNFSVVRLADQNFLLKIVVRHETQEKTLSFFAKVSPKTAKINQILFDDFRKTIPKFDSKITPRFYYGRADLLLFEDLGWQGFKNFNSESGFFSLEHVRVVLGVLAKFHAGSFAYEEIKTKQLGRIYRLDQEHKMIHSVVDVKKKEAIDLISWLLEDKSEDDLFKVVEDLNDRQLSKKFRRTLCHGNLIRENIMFKCDQKVPIESRLINFRSKQYSPPICDVLQVIFFNTSEDLRRKYFHSLLSYYHDCLKKELEKYCLDIGKIFPVEDLHQGAHHFSPLIKLETAVLHRNSEKVQELREILNCPLLSREDCYEIVKNKTNTTDYELLSFRVTPLDQVNGYLGNYHKLQLSIRLQNQDTTINCFVKCVPKSDASKDIVQETGCFFKEIFIYQILVPQMQKLNIDTITECLPFSYFQRSEDLIVFDDISIENSRSLPSQIPYDLTLLSLTVKKLAKFHASMFAFEEKMSEKIGRQYRLGEEYGEYLREIFFLKDETHAGAVLMQTGVRSILDVVSLFPEIKIPLDFKKVWPKLEHLFFEVIKPSDRYRNVLSHGDLWTNNVMVQFDNDKPIDCRFVDYQCTRYCPPAHDLLSVLYLTTDRATRSKHEEEIKQIYYKELNQILSLYNCDVAKIYPHEEFVDTIDYIRPQMVMQSIMYNMFCTCTSEEISSFLTDDEVCKRVFFEDRKEYLTKMCEKSSFFKAKLQECLLDLYDFCDTISCSL